MVRNWIREGMRAVFCAALVVCALVMLAGDASAQQCGANCNGQRAQFRPVRNFLGNVFGGREVSSASNYAASSGGCSAGCSGVSSAYSYSVAPAGYSAPAGIVYGAPVTSPKAGTVAVFDGSTWREIVTEPAPVVQATYYRPEPASYSLSPTWAPVQYGAPVVRYNCSNGVCVPIPVK